MRAPQLDNELSHAHDRPIGLPRVGAPERPGHATLRDETHRGPATLRNPFQSLLVSASLLPELRDSASPRHGRAITFVTVLFVQLRRTLVARHGLPPVFRSDELSVVPAGSNAPSRRSSAVLVKSRATELAFAARPSRATTTPVAPKLQTQAVRRSCFMQLAPASCAAKAFGALPLDPANQSFYATDALAIRRATRRRVGLLAGGRVPRLA